MIEAQCAQASKEITKIETQCAQASKEITLKTYNAPNPKMNTCERATMHPIPK
jgi:hypothetical protein